MVYIYYLIAQYAVYKIVHYIQIFLNNMVILLMNSGIISCNSICTLSIVKQNTFHIKPLLCDTRHEQLILNYSFINTLTYIICHLYIRTSYCMLLEMYIVIKLLYYCLYY